MPHELISAALTEHRKALEGVAALTADIEAGAKCITDVLAIGGTVFACGNGGSAADAQHFATEISGRFERERPGYPAVALTTDTSALTAIGNDYGFNEIFARQLQALGRKGDLLVAISTSGQSPNVVRAVQAAKERGILTIGLLGRDGGGLAGEVDLALVVPAERTARIQEMHILILHLWCALFEANL